MPFPVNRTENEIGRNVACVGEMINTNVLQKNIRKETIRDLWS